MGRLIGVVSLLAVAAVLPGTAAAAPLPGTPHPVAPGVPGHGRAWELVTPEDVISGFLNRTLGISSDGNRLVFRSFGSLPGASESPLIAESMAVRGAGGWTTTPIAKPVPLATEFWIDELVALSPQLTSSIWINRLPNSSLGLFRSQPGGGYSLLADIGSNFSFLNASTDLGRLLFSTTAQLLPADSGRTSGRSIYQATGSSLSLVNVDSSGSLLSECGASTTPQGFSADGQRAFFASPDPSQPCTDPSRVYLRAGSTTTEISASHCTRVDCNAPADVDFVGATRDGSSAYLATAQQLTDDDTNASRDLYRYDVSDEELSLLTPRTNAEPAEVTADPVLAAADGSRVYFWAVGELVDDVGAEPEDENLYMADAAGLHFVTRRVEDELQIFNNGRYAIFATTDLLVNADNDESADAYRYDATDGTYDWLSTGPLGGNGNVPAEFRPAYFGESVVTHPYRVASADGEHVFFTTTEQLLAEDKNTREDVYEWVDGNLGLVSPGTPGLKAWYTGVTPDGNTAMIVTSATLLPRDRDGGDLDYYAARVGGGFPEPTEPPDCTGAACRGSIAPRVERGLPASVSPPPQRGIRLVPIGPDAARQIVASGWLTVLAEVPGPGRVSAAASAKLDGRRQKVAAGAVRAKEAGQVRLRLRLSKAARAALGQGKSLRVGLAVRQGSTLAPTLGFKLGGAR